MPSSGTDRKRGRHKKHTSRGTQTWNREHLIPPRPWWMPEATYTKLAEMRNR